MTDPMIVGAIQEAIVEAVGRLEERIGVQERLIERDRGMEPLPDGPPIDLGERLTLIKKHKGEITELRNLARALDADAGVDVEPLLPSLDDPLRDELTRALRSISDLGSWAEWVQNSDMLRGQQALARDGRLMPDPEYFRYAAMRILEGKSLYLPETLHDIEMAVRVHTRGMAWPESIIGKNGEIRGRLFKEFAHSTPRAIELFCEMYGCPEHAGALGSAIKRDPNKPKEKKGSV